MECGKCKWWGKKFPRLLLGVDVKPAGLIVTLGGDWGVQAHKTCLKKKKKNQSKICKCSKNRIK